MSQVNMAACVFKIPVGSMCSGTPIFNVLECAMMAVTVIKHYQNADKCQPLDARPPMHAVTQVYISAIQGSPPYTLLLPWFLTWLRTLDYMLSFNSAFDGNLRDIHVYHFSVFFDQSCQLFDILNTHSMNQSSHENPCNVISSVTSGKFELCANIYHCDQDWWP